VSKNKYYEYATCTHTQRRKQQVNRTHIKITYLLTAPESAQGK